jgi:hypothetical protein
MIFTALSRTAAGFMLHSGSMSPEFSRKYSLADGAWQND